MKKLTGIIIICMLALILSVTIFAHEKEGVKVTIYNPYVNYGFNPNGFNPNGFNPNYCSLKGQLHCHTLNSDGDQSPYELVSAYRDAGYDFITITDHMVVTPNPNVPGIIWLGGGCEGGALRHIGGVDVTDNFSMGRGSTQESISYNFDKNKICWLAHPIRSWDCICSENELKHYYDLHFIEVCNSIVSHMMGSFITCDEQWDTMLSNNVRVSAFAVDDCHDINNSATFNRGWIMVNSNTKSKDAILTEIRNGNYYSSTGNDIQIKVEGNTITAYSPCESNFYFIVKDGITAKEEHNKTFASYTVKGREQYIRVKSVKVSDDTQIAWSNPLYVGAN